MITRRLAVFVLALALLAAFATPASAKGRPITLSVETHTDDGYAVKLYIDPFVKLREKLPDNIETFDVVVVDNGKAQVIRDPIFVVGN